MASAALVPAMLRGNPEAHRKGQIATVIGKESEGWCQLWRHVSKPDLCPAAVTPASPSVAWARIMGICACCFDVFTQKPAREPSLLLPACSIAKLDHSFVKSSPLAERTALTDACSKCVYIVCRCAHALLGETRVGCCSMAAFCMRAMRRA